MCGGREPRFCSVCVYVVSVRVVLVYARPFALRQCVSKALLTGQLMDQGMRGFPVFSINKLLPKPNRSTLTRLYAQDSVGTMEGMFSEETQTQKQNKT